MDVCSERLQFKIDGWKAEYTDMHSACGDPFLRDVVKLYWDGLDLLRRMRDELEQLRDGIVPATARFSAAPAGHGGDHGDPTAVLVARIDLLSRQVDDMEELVNCVATDIRWGITYEIKNKQEQEIYSMRVIQRMSYPEIAHDAGYSGGYCRKVVSRCGKLTTCIG